MQRVSQVFKRSKLEELAQENGFSELCREEEEKRSNNDLMYCIFKRPEQCIDKLYPRLIKLIEKKYAPDLTRSRIFTDTVTSLPSSDMVVRVFFTLLIISREEEAQTVIKAGYKSDGLWINPSIRFQNKYLPMLKQIIDTAFNEPFGEVNIVGIMTWVIKEAQRVYMIK